TGVVWSKSVQLVIAILEIETKKLAVDSQSTYLVQEVMTGAKGKWKVIKKASSKNSSDSVVSTLEHRNIISAVPEIKVSCTSVGVAISWKKIDGANYYEIYRRTGKEKLKRIGTINTENSFVDKTVVPGMTYTYMIKAANDMSESNSKEKSICYNKTAANQPVKTSTMYRLYNPNSGEHFYTQNISEKKYLVKVGWNDEGIGWIAPKTSKTPVYRLYNPNAGDHHYTCSKQERDYLVRAGWNYENIGWYSDDKKGSALYRQYNPNAVTGTHNYTLSKSENDMLVKIGWKEEGIGWYGVKSK
ncbi:MAG: hypothetical protein Q4B22_09225, partial [Eubacteriales bacterium]|nr:hypothetical protein [Eubacteriales bacterium]